MSETLFYLVLLTATQKILISNTGGTVPYLSLILWLHAVFIHSPTKMNFGPLRIILADNKFHRIHHSLEPRHHDRNFGAFTTLWDRLFGTAHFPEKGEWPAVGIAGVPQPNRVGEWLALPYRMGQAGPRDIDQLEEGVKLSSDSCIDDDISGTPMHGAHGKLAV